MFFATSNPHNSIWPSDFIATLDGSIKPLAMESLVYPGKNISYPARFQIPSKTFWGHNKAQKTQRAKMFAMTSLLYEIFSDTHTLENLSDNEVQNCYSNGVFPDDAISLFYLLGIYSG